MAGLFYRDLVWGVLVLVFAVGYYIAADGIPRSLLSDTVGPGGAPKLLALGLGASSVLLIVRSFLSRRPVSDTGEASGWRPHALALGMLGFGIGYLLLVSHLGYVLTLFLLITGVIVYSGMRLSVRLVLIGAAGSVLFWIIFAMLFRTSMPSGVWPRLFG
jgi:hypothetical protein